MLKILNFLKMNQLIAYYPKPRIKTEMKILPPESPFIKDFKKYKIIIVIIKMLELWASKYTHVNIKSLNFPQNEPSKACYPKPNANTEKRILPYERTLIYDFRKYKIIIAINKMLELYASKHNHVNVENSNFPQNESFESLLL